MFIWWVNVCNSAVCMDVIIVPVKCCNSKSWVFNKKFLFSLLSNNLVLELLLIQQNSALVRFSSECELSGFHDFLCKFCCVRVLIKTEPHTTFFTAWGKFHDEKWAMPKGLQLSEAIYYFSTKMEKKNENSMSWLI